MIEDGIGRAHWNDPPPLDKSDAQGLLGNLLRRAGVSLAEDLNPTHVWTFYPGLSIPGGPCPFP